jgi:cell division protein FtsN
MWLFSGILIGLGLAWYLAAKGYIPQAGQPVANDTTPQSHGESLLPEEISTEEEKPGKSRYDFFTVLPEMEVIVPEQELAKQQELARQQEAANPATVATASDSYLLQVGSFKSVDEADEMKAQLALTGIEAAVQSVKVNDATWYRVRVGPVQGAREADEIRLRLQANGIDSLVMKNP